MQCLQWYNVHDVNGLYPVHGMSCQPGHTQDFAAFRVISVGGEGTTEAVGGPMPRTIVASVAAGLLVAGCAADSSMLQRALVMPSGYDALPCPEVVAKYKAADGRVKELAALMEKSNSPIANALAYNSEYASAQASRRFAEEAAGRKGCDLGNKPPPAPPLAQPMPIGQPTPLGPEPPTAQAQPKKQ